MCFAGASRKGHPQASRKPGCCSHMALPEAAFKQINCCHKYYVSVGVTFILISRNSFEECVCRRFHNAPWREAHALWPGRVAFSIFSPHFLHSALKEVSVLSISSGTILISSSHRLRRACARSHTTLYTGHAFSGPGQNHQTKRPTIFHPDGSL